MVRKGEIHEHQGIKVKLVEVIPYYTFKGRRHFLIAYRIIDGKYTSPVAHFWMAENEDIREKIEAVVKHYLEIRKTLSIV